MTIERKKSTHIKVKTLCNKTICVPSTSVRTVSDLKRELCEGSIIGKDDISIIYKGKICPDTDEISPSSGPERFVIIRCTASKTVEVVVKEGRSCATAKFPINMRVSELKRRLYTMKSTTLLPGEQRMILNGRVMHDSYLLGDHFLQRCKQSSRNYSPPIIYLSRTINLRSEIDVNLTLPNGQTAKFSLEVGDSLCYAFDILERQFGFSCPPDLKLVLTMEDGRPISPSMSLFDYGVMPSCKSVNMRLRVAEKNAPVVVPIKLVASPSGNILECTPLSSAPLLNSTQLKKKPEPSKDTNDMFRGMKKGFLSSSKSNRKKTSAIKEVKADCSQNAETGNHVTT